jgi:hypothetical protein
MAGAAGQSVGAAASAADSAEDPTMAARKVTLIAEDRDTVRRHIAQDRPIEAITYLHRKYRDAGLGLKEATEAVFVIAPSARKHMATTWKSKRKSKSKRKKAPAKRAKRYGGGGRAPPRGAFSSGAVADVAALRVERDAHFKSYLCHETPRQLLGPRAGSAPTSYRTRRGSPRRGDLG